VRRYHSALLQQELRRLAGVGRHDLQNAADGSVPRGTEDEAAATFRYAAFDV
jgi:hypothetical protein